MAITNRDQLVAALAGQRVYPWVKYPSATVNPPVAWSLASAWKIAGQPGLAAATPTSATLCSSATPGALHVPGLTTGSTWYLSNLTAVVQPGLMGPLSLLDRLSHRGGLSGTVATAQPVGLSLPTRSTDKTQVQIWLEINTSTGATPRTVAVSYTNENGTAGRTATLPANASLPASPAATLLFGPLDLQAGDLGVTSVETLTLAGSTGTAGDFSVVLLRPVAQLNLMNVNAGFWSADQVSVPATGLLDLGADPCLMLAYGYGLYLGTASHIRGEIALCQG